MPRLLLITGLDYGTSFTKMVVRDNNASGRPAEVVTSQDHVNGLVPSLIGIQDGNLLFPPFPESAASIPYVKMLAAHVASGRRLGESLLVLPKEAHELADKVGNDRDFIRSLLAFYFSNLMVNVEKFITAHSVWKDFDFQRKVHDDQLIFQLAVPSGLMNDDDAVEQLFREALVAGYLLRHDPCLACNQKVPAIEWNQMVVQCFAKENPLAHKKFKWQCLLYPETAGAVQAYFRSRNAQTGLFITMDVGAGTVDLNAFRRELKIRDSSYYATKVCSLGDQNMKSPLFGKVPMDQVMLMEELQSQIGELNRRARKHQPNHGSVVGRKTWDDATFFIFGGGASHKAYWTHYKLGLQNSGIYNPKIFQLPSPEDLIHPKNVHCGRFTVAYGLSIFKMNLDKIKLPNELEKFAERYPPKEEDEPPPYGFNWED